MKKGLLFIAVLATATNCLNAQVTQLNNNNSLQVVLPLSNGKTILYSNIDSSLWSTDGTAAGTIQISDSVKFLNNEDLLGGKFIFNGSTPSTGTELYTTDGTKAGTTLIKDINAGPGSSTPGPKVLLNGFFYFSAVTVAEGRELWRTDGTASGTTLVKDIVPGPASSNSIDSFNLFSNGSFLLFAAAAAGLGVELWKSDGTPAGTNLLLDINSGADSSNPREFSLLNSTVLFFATDVTNGEELWKTDGTAGGTVLVKDINPGPAGSTSFQIFPGIFASLLIGFHDFNNHAFFNATDGNSIGEIWGTDGTTAGTFLLKNVIQTTASPGELLIIDAINLSNTFIFPVSDRATRFELWQSDGTPSGTAVFDSFPPPSTSDFPFIFLSYNINFTARTVTYPLFQGNKFFFAAGSLAAGYELWISDGTLAGTHMVKDINPGTGNGLDISNGLSYLYTQNALYFAANDGTTGDELWTTDGTAANTSLVYDINPGAGNADPSLPIFLCNGKIIFTATDGDDPILTDLFEVNGNFVALPVKLTDFTVTPQGNDAMLQWSTQQEINSKNYTVQRSYDGQNFTDIGTVKAGGNVYTTSRYSFIDQGIMNCGKEIVYYRLNAVDIDDRSALTNIISLKIKGNGKWNVKLMANPVQESINLMVNGTTGKLQLAVRDILGRMVYSTTFENTNGLISIPLSMQRGTYFLTAENNQEQQVIKFVK